MSRSIDAFVDRVTHGDCLSLLNQIPSESVDLVVTDPPYLVRYRDRDGRSIANDDQSHWVYPAFAEMYRVLKPDSYCVSFYGWGKADKFLWAWRQAGFQPVHHFVFVKKYASFVRHAQGRHEMAYLLVKGNPTPPDAPPSDIQGWTYTGNKLHPTQKPVDSMKPLIEAYSKPGDVVLDPFAGSGTTGIAARECKRRFILIEKDPTYFLAARDRLN